MDTNGSAVYRKLLVPALITIVVLVAAVSAYIFFFQARITITAPVGSTITVSRVIDDVQVAQKKTTDTTTTIALSSADYAVTIGNSNTSKQLFYVSTRIFHDTKLIFNAESELHTITVAKRPAYNVVVQGDAISYLDTTRRAIVNITNDGVVSVLGDTALFGSLTSDNPGTAQGMYPIANGQAIILSDGKLYVLQNNQLIPLNVTGLPNTSSPFMVGTNPTQKSFVIAINQALYYYSSPNAMPQKIVNLNKRINEVAYGGNKVIAYSTRMPLAKEDIKSAYSSYAIDPIIVDIAAKTQKVLTNGPIVDASVAPDGQHATIEPQSEPYTTIYDIGQNTPPYTILSPDTTTPAWLDNTHFVYGKGSDIWKFDTINRIGIAVGTVPNSQQPTSVTYNSDSGKYYVTTYATDTNATIFSLSSEIPDLNSEKAANLDTTSQTSDLFTLNYVDISQPTIHVLTNIISNNPSPTTYKTLTLQSRQAALEYIKSKGVDPDKLTITYDPTF